MKKFVVASLSALSLSAFAADIQLQNLSRSDVQKVGNEFAVNFAHTTVSAPETDGLWGVEVGLVGGQTASPNLKKVVNASGGDGKDVKNIYHGGLMARAHFPLDLFVEGSVLPQREFSDIEVESRSLGLGWNAGAFFGLPLDLAVGLSGSRGEVSFTQDPTSTIPAESKINVKTQSMIYYVGASKTFLFFTPYAKVGYGRSQADIKVDTTADSTVFSYTDKKKESVDKNGGYLALGANLQFFFFKLGFEVSQMNGVKNGTAKFSLDF